MSLEISHLVVNGCSFTWGQGLEDRANNNWAALLAKKIGVPVVNLSNPGAGCDRIFRTTHEYFYKDNTNNNKPFYIIAWTSALRREEWQIAHKGYYNINLVDPVTNLSAAFLEQMNESGMIEYVRKKYVYWASIINLFQAFNINNFMTEFMPSYEYSDDQLKKFNPYIFDYITQNSNNIKRFFDITNKLPKLKCGHDTLETQHILADYCYQEMIDRYGEIIPVKMQHTSQDSLHIYTN
jgi:hypothetical protein